PILAVLALSAAGAFIEPARAEHWCSLSNEGAFNCAYTSFDRCRETVSGTGGSCMPEAPVGHRQPATNHRPLPRDQKLDAIINRTNRQASDCPAPSRAHSVAPSAMARASCIETLRSEITPCEYATVGSTTVASAAASAFKRPVMTSLRPQR